MTEEEKNKIVENYLNSTFKVTEENQLAIIIGSKCFTEGLEKGLEENKKENEKLKKEIDNLRQDKNSLAHNVIMLGNIIKEKEGLWGELEKRFVEVVKTCTPEEKAKCPMFPEYCEGECKERIDLLALLEKAADKGDIQ